MTIDDLLRVLRDGRGTYSPSGNPYLVRVLVKTPDAHYSMCPICAAWFLRKGTVRTNSLARVLGKELGLGVRAVTDLIDAADGARSEEAEALRGRLREAVGEAA